MTKNMGTADRVLRIIAAVVIGILCFTGQLSGIAAVILGIIAIAFLGTSIIGVCPGYWPLKISTCKKSPAESQQPGA